MKVGLKIEKSSNNNIYNGLDINDYICNSTKNFKKNINKECI